MPADDAVITCTLTLSADGVLTVSRSPECGKADVYELFTAALAGDVDLIDVTAGDRPPRRADQGTPHQ